MTEPVDDGIAGPSPPIEDPTTATATGSPSRAAAPGLFRFSIEGRRAPALFVVGWLATLVGLGLAIVAVQAGGELGASVLWFVGFIALAAGGVLLAGSQTVERRAAGEPYAGPSPVLVFLLVIVASQLLGYVVGVPLLASGVQLPRAVGDLVAVAVQAVAFLGVVRLAVVGPGALRWSEMGLKGDGRAILAGLAGGALFAAPVILLTTVVGLVAISIAGTTPPSPLPPTGTPAGLALHLVAGALIAPVYEEILFRGVAVTAWARTVGARGAILRSSILFVLAHVLLIGGESFGQAVAAAAVATMVRLPIAVALAWLYLRTGALWAPIGLHVAFNGILILLGETAGGRGLPALVALGIPG